MADQLTVAALIAYLQSLPAGMPVVYRRMSEWEPMTLEDIDVDDTFDNGGYISRVYREQDRLLVLRFYFPATNTHISPNPSHLLAIT